MESLYLPEKYQTFIDDFFDPTQSHCDVISSFLINVYDFKFGLTVPEIQTEIENMNNFINCDENVFFNTIPQPQAFDTCTS
jgi:hypothetical protein